MSQTKSLNLPTWAVLQFHTDGSIYYGRRQYDKSSSVFLSDWAYLTKIDITWSISHFGDPLNFHLGSTGSVISRYQDHTMGRLSIIPMPFMR